MNEDREPIHPGEILADELSEIGINASQFAQKIGVSENCINQIVRGKGSITADIALRLGKFFNTGAKLWLNLQNAYELDVAQDKIGEQLDRIFPYQSQDSPSVETSWIT